MSAEMATENVSPCHALPWASPDPLILGAAPPNPLHLGVCNPTPLYLEASHPKPYVHIHIYKCIYVSRCTQRILRNRTGFNDFTDSSPLHLAQHITTPQHTASHCITWHHITSHNTPGITSFHSTEHTWHHITSDNTHGITSHHTTHIASHHITSHFTSDNITWHHTTTPHYAPNPSCRKYELGPGKRHHARSRFSHM